MRVVGDKGQFIRMQAEVERVCHATDRRDPEIRLQVLGLVPHQGGDPVTLSESGLLQTCCQSAGPAVQVAVGRTTNGVVWQAGNHFNPREKFARPLQERRERQTVLHHRSLQIFASLCSAGFYLLHEPA